MEQKKRIAWIDMAKGYGILLVILGHLDVGPFGSWIYTFHMPLFFFLSGYVFNGTNSFPLFLKKKVKSIALPYFYLGIPTLLYTALHDCSSGEYASLVFDFLIQRRLWTLWFLACLFFLNILFYIALKVLKTARKLAVLSVILPIIGWMYYRLGGAPLPWNIDVCAMAFPYFFAGCFYKKNHEAFDRFFHPYKRGIPLFLIFGVANVGFGYLSYSISGLRVNMWGSEYGVAPLTYLSAFSGIICTVILSKMLIIPFVRYIGENSLLYFAWHYILIFPISRYLLKLVGLVRPSFEVALYIRLFWSGCMLIITLAILTVINIIVTKTPLKFMVGK